MNEEGKYQVMMLECHAAIRMSNKLTLAKFMLDMTLNPKSFARTHTLHTSEFKLITPDCLLAAARFNSCFFLSECAKR